MPRRTSRTVDERNYLSGSQDDAEAIERYLVLRGQAERTRQAYAQILGRLQIWCTSNAMASFCELLPTHACQFQSDLAQGQVPTRHASARAFENGSGENRLGMSLGTVDQYIGVVRTFFDNLLRAGYLTSNPFHELPDLSLEKAIKPLRPKLRGVDEPLIAELLSTVEMLPRHSPRYMDIYHQTRWVLCLTTMGGMNTRDIAGASLGNFVFRSNSWYLVPNHRLNVQSFMTSQSVMLGEQLLCELRTYCEWLRQGLANDAVDLMSSLEERLALPMVSAVGNLGIAVNEGRMHVALRHIIDRTVARLEEAGQSQRAEFIARLYQRRTGPRHAAISPGLLGSQVDATALQRFYTGHVDCPSGPEYVAAGGA